MCRRYRNGWWLEIKYWDEGLTQQEIADECDVSPRTVREYMKRYDIPVRDIAGENHPLYGQTRAEEIRRRIADALTGRTVSRKTRERMAKSHEGQAIPEQIREKISRSLSGRTLSEETRKKMSRSTAGSDNPNWKGGYSRRYGPGWSLARKCVLNRDEECQYCRHDGSDRRLEVHHIIPVRRFRESDTVSLEEAHRLENLILLCRRCHMRAEHGHIEIEAPAELIDAIQSS